MEPTVTTTSGALRGADSGGIKVFKGIPYAAPPVGRLRFRPPQPIAPWSDVRDALECGPSCPQPRQRPPGWSFEDRESEDCLYLNVWTPGLDDARRPVMVWIHGGGYSIGSGSWPLYDGTELARRGDVVVVTVNHRLGPFGYLHFGELAGEEFASSGNNGQLDLVVALEWVRDNAAAFGGDASNVTVFGESGGGAKISALLATPAAQGLFHRAAIQSGPGLRVSSIERATRNARTVLEEVGVAGVDDLWDVPADKLVAAMQGGFRTRLGPVLDGRFMTIQPEDALRSGEAADVPVLIGCNRDEVFRGVRDDLDEAGLRERLSAMVPDHLDEVLSTYRNVHPDASWAQLASFIPTDAGMRLGSTRLAEAKLEGSSTPVFMYFFTYEMAGRAGHGYEIGFVFHNVSRPSPPRLKLAAEMSEAWLAFARDGEPGHDGVPKWPAYTLPDRATMIFARDECVLVNDPAGPTRKLWRRLPPTRRMSLSGA